MQVFTCQSQLKELLINQKMEKEETCDFSNEYGPTHI